MTSSLCTYLLDARQYDLKCCKLEWEYEVLSQLWTALGTTIGDLSNQEISSDCSADYLYPFTGTFSFITTKDVK